MHYKVLDRHTWLLLFYTVRMPSLFQFHSGFKNLVFIPAMSEPSFWVSLCSQETLRRKEEGALHKHHLVPLVVDSRHDSNRKQYAVVGLDEECMMHLYDMIEEALVSCHVVDGLHSELKDDYH